MSTREVLIRKMESDEKKELKKVMNDAFPLLMRLMYYFTNNILVAEKDGKIVGGIILKIFSITKEMKGGLIAFIFTSPSVQGEGIGQRLATEGIKLLEDSGCSEIFASVEGNNTSSSNLFSNRGFSIWSISQQFKVYGLRMFMIWYKTFHTFDIGHFLWVKSSNKISENKGFKWIPNVTINTLVLLLVFLRRGELEYMKIGKIIELLVGIGIIFLLRDIPMYIVAKLKGLRVIYRFWETGHALNIFLAGIIGTFLPITGSLYPENSGWSYKKEIPKLGAMAFFSSLVVVISVVCMRGVIENGIYIGGLEPYIGVAYSYGRTLLIFDVILPVFPFRCYNGSRIFDWNKGLWLILSIPAIILNIV